MTLLGGPTPDNPRVLFVVSGDRTIASTRYRILNLIPYLEESGFECNVHSLEKGRVGPGTFDPLKKIIFALGLLLRAPFYDVVYVQRLWFPPVYLKLFNILAHDFIYDFDDALYTTPWWVKKNEQRQERLHVMLSKASYVIAGSPVLAEYASQYTDQLRCLPTPLPQERYEFKREERTPTIHPVTIGWIGNSQNLRYLATIEEPLQRVLDEHNDVRLLVITAEERAVAPLEDRDDVTYREWSLEKELDYLSEADIVIRPLTDDEWTRGKGGFTSVVQAMALEIPVVVTPIAWLKNLVAHGESGFHATTDDEWIRHLGTLIESPAKRTDMGAEAAKRIQFEELWTENHAQELIDIVQGVGMKFHD